MFNLQNIYSRYKKLCKISPSCQFVGLSPRAHHLFSHRDRLELHWSLPGVREHLALLEAAVWSLEVHDPVERGVEEGGLQSEDWREVR